MSVKDVVSASLSSSYEKRYVVVDEASGDVFDDAQGYGYKTAQNAHRAYKSMSPTKNRQRDAAKRRVVRWCGQHPDVVEHLEQAAFYAAKDGENVTAVDVRAILAERGLELPFPVEDLTKHW